VKAGVTLTIEPGTVIRGDKTNKGTLIVERGAQLNAQGTAAQPIVFTSNQASGSRDYGDWGGLIICGNATINQAGGVATIEGGVGAQYGGGATPNDADNSGTIKYLRVEFPGIAFAPNNEINGITFGGVGSGTTLDYIQVSFSGDDSYEWFGGTVNAKHIIAFRGWDDEFDTDNGFRGKIQFGVSLRDPNIADVSGSNGFESDNDASGSGNLPTTKPIFSNMSFFGPKITSSTVVNSNFKRAMHIRRNSKLSVFNSVFAGYPIGLFIDGSSSQANATANDLRIENCYLAGMTTTFVSAFEQTYFLEPSRNNSVLASNTMLNVVDPFNLTTPNFLPNNTPNVYLLNGWVYVKSGATLTIEPGTIIRGDKVNKAALIIERGGQLIAEGTSTAPIVFTSNQAAGSRDYGDWGGLIICGNDSINQAGGVATIEGGVGAQYGGGTTPIANDNSGILKYVRVEFPGIAFAPNNEINGITFGGVGSGTTVDFVQVSYSGDDSYEWFGGSVNARHIVALRGWDDDFDTDNGFRGMVQFGVSLRDPAVADVSGSNGFESDNDASGSSNSPGTRPIFSNISFFGPKVTAATVVNSNHKRAFHIRRNSRLNAINTIFCGYPTGMYIDGNATMANANNNELRLENNIMSGMDAFFAVPASQTWSVADARAYWTSAARHNDTVPTNAAMLITDPFNLTAPNFLPMAGSPVRNHSYWTRTLSGQVTYMNTGSTPMNNSTVILKNNNNVILEQQATTATGNYSFKVMDGTYKIDATTVKVSGGLNSNDALGTVKHFVGISPLTGLKLEAADVNASQSVNSTDALLIQKKFVGVISSFAAGSWVFEKNTVVVNANTTLNFKAICFGDVNGSFGNPAKENSSITLLQSGNVVMNPVAENVLSLRTLNALETAALSLIMNVPAGLEITNVSLGNGTTENLVFLQTADELRISWYGIEAMNLNAGDILLNITAKSANINDMNSISIAGGSSIADASGETLSKVDLSLPKAVQIAPASMTIDAYPNPSHGSLNITVSMKEQGLVSLNVLNALGQLAKHLESISLNEGTQTLNYDISDLDNGIYFLQVQTEKAVVQSSVMTKLVLTR